MEGSPYEKAGLVFFAYLIGFVTSFIAFGIGSASLDEDITFYRASYVKPVEKVNDFVEGTVAIKNDTGLFVSIDGNKTLLTANRASLIEGAYPELTNGIHYGVSHVSVSPNGDFVYYCEQLTEESEECDPIVYDVRTDIAHRVAVEANPTANDHRVTWLEDNKLQLNDFISTDNNQPWK